MDIQVQEGRLIVLTGLEGCKTAHYMKALGLLLRKGGARVKELSFPRYHMPTGSRLRSILSGEYGDPLRLPPSVMALLYADDRARAREEIQDELHRGALVLCKGYTPCQAYQIARAEDGEFENFFAEVERIDYVMYGMPRPTCVLFLDIPPALSLVHTEVGDVSYALTQIDHSYDGRLAFQKSVREVFKKIGERTDHWHAVQLGQWIGNGVSLRPHDEVLMDMLKVLQNNGYI